MQYEKEIDGLLREFFLETWMSESDFNEMVDLVFQQTGVTKEKLSEDIEVGIRNGHSYEQQLKILRKLFIDNK